MPLTPNVGGRPRLVLLSLLMLFVELALIRWTASNVLYLGAFTNFVLLASFLGIGIGFLRAKGRTGHLHRAVWALAALVLFVWLFPVAVSRLGGTRQVVGWFGLPALPNWVELPLIFAGAATVMASIGEEVARSFATFPALQAYQLDIAGSLAGIAAFSVLSFLGAPPIAWGLVAALLLLVLIGSEPRRRHVLATLAIVVPLAVQSLTPGLTWSPYYQIRTHTATDGTVDIRVNGLPHQTIVPLAALTATHAFYFLPYDHLDGQPPRDVLIIGAGSGNDVAVALSEGARHVDAVEIDPVLHHIGVLRHPDHPYQDARVTSSIVDGRAFLQRSDRRYDLILFALPDSLTLVAGQSSLRLESYLFTVESLEAARTHLRPGGAFAMYNYYQPFVLDRFAGTLRRVFGRAPCVDLGPGVGARPRAVLTVGRSGGDVRCDRTWSPPSAERVPAPITDDRPFPYLPGRTIPRFYVVALLLMLLASALSVRLASGTALGLRPYADLFLMGAAFLLLETKNVVQFALLFGTTWFVNALVFAGILLSVLAAVQVARTRLLPRAAFLYVSLFAALAVAWVVPPHALLRLPPVPRFAAASVLAFAPIFLANLVFSQRFKDVASSTVAFAANLLGAMVGGVLEYSALVTGYRFLLIVVGALYACAFAAGRASLTTRSPAPRARPRLRRA